MSHPDEHASYGPGDALRDVSLARGEIIERGATPTWYHPVIGSALGLVLLVEGLDLAAVLKAVVLAGSAIVTAAAVVIYSRRSGMLFSLRQTSRKGGAILAALVSALFVSVVVVIVGREAGHVWMIAAGALLAPVLYTVIGRAYDRQVFRDIRADRVDAPWPNRL